MWEIYIGQTKRLVYTRGVEHLPETECAKKNNNHHIRSAVAKHTVEQEYELSWEHTEPDRD